MSEVEIPQVIEKRGPGRPKGLGRVPGSGRKPGTPNKINADLKELILTKGRPVEFLISVVRGVKMRVGPPAGPGAEYVYPSPEMRFAAARELLDKIMPDLRATELTGADGGPIQHQGGESAREPLEHKIENIARRIAFVLDAGAAEAARSSGERYPVRPELPDIVAALAPPDDMPPRLRVRAREPPRLPQRAADNILLLARSRAQVRPRRPRPPPAGGALMPRLPDVQSFGPRPVEAPQRALTRMQAPSIGQAEQTVAAPLIAGEVLQATAQRIFAREDAIARSEDGASAIERGQAEYRRRSTEGDGFRSLSSTIDFKKWLDADIERTVAAHRGSADSKARLRERLIENRGRLIDEAAAAGTRAQIAALRADIDRRVAAVTAGVLENPTSLSQAFASIDAIIDDAAEALPPEEEIELRALYRAQTSVAAVEGMMARGAYREARELLAIPGIAESLSPAQQTNFSSRLETVERQEREARLALRGRLDDIAYALGTTAEQLPLWARVQAVGLDMPKAAAYQPQSPAGKLLADRQHFVSQFGENSPQVAAFDDLAQSEGDKPSLSDVGSIRNQFTGLSKDFVAVRDAYNRVVASARTPSPASDLSLLFNYMKILDPGSVVREGEFATAQNAANWSGRMRSLYNAVVEGTRLTEEQRADFLGRAEDLMRAQTASQRRLEDQFRGIAERSGVNPDDVVVDFIGKDGDGGPAAEQAGATPSAAQPRRIAYDLQGNPIGGGEP